MLRYASVIDQLVVDDLDRLFPGGVHAPHPFHLVIGFEHLRDAVLLGKLLYKLKKHLFRLAVDVGNNMN